MLSQIVVFNFVLKYLSIDDCDIMTQSRILCIWQNAMLIMYFVIIMKFLRFNPVIILFNFHKEKMMMLLVKISFFFLTIDKQTFYLHINKYFLTSKNINIYSNFKSFFIVSRLFVTRVLKKKMDWSDIKIEINHSPTHLQNKWIDTDRNQILNFFLVFLLLLSSGWMMMQSICDDITNFVIFSCEVPVFFLWVWRHLLGSYVIVVIYTYQFSSWMHFIYMTIFWVRKRWFLILCSV